MAYGGDYNPEQWPEQTWPKDIALMREAKVNLVSVGIFSWALIQPGPDTFEFGWLDRVMDLLHEGGIRVDLATATASPPPWLSRKHPETLPVTADGTRLWPGARQAFCPSSPVVRNYGLRLVEAIATRYVEHPALALWHVSNELGCHNAHCFCDVSAAAFRAWLRRRYGGLDALNDAWGTAFWSQRYGDWEEILPPRSAPTFPNPTQRLDWFRFSSDQLLDNVRAERELLHRITPDVPVTTNLMVSSHVKYMDYLSWGHELDLVSNDHYLDAADPEAHVELAFSADLTRGVALGEPWLLMEHSTSAVNWQPRNIAKQPGELVRNSLQHVARGSDGALFFQWRASRAGAEKFHSALVPHAGTDTKIWRDVTRLGANLDALSEVVGSRVEARVAMVFDWQAWWAAELDSHPTADVTYLDRAHAHYRALWERGVTVDFVPPEAGLSAYPLVIVPTLYTITDAGAETVRRYVERGGTVLVTYFSGIVDEHDHIRLGGYPGAFREVLGARTEEFFPLREGETVGLSDGTTATVWTELLHPEGADVVASYVGGPLPGVAALTRHRYGRGTAWYAATRLDVAGVAALTDRLLAETGVGPVVDAPRGVEVVRRRGAGASYLFVINHGGTDADVPVTGTDLLTGDRAEGKVSVRAGDVAVVREDAAAGGPPYTRA